MIRSHALALLLFAGCAGSSQAPAPATTPEPGPEPAAAPVAAPAAAPEAKPALEVPPERAVQIKLPSGATVTADHIVAPAEGTPEHAIVQSISLISAGDFDTWVTRWCDPTLCDSPEAIEGLKLRNLPAAQGTSKACLGEDGNSVTVTRRDAPDGDGNVHVYVFCGEGRMPAPAALHERDGSFRVASFSW